jgi:type IV secretory pathway ATPase VirB11/archaellum biosynthesis ATPase
MMIFMVLPWHSAHRVPERPRSIQAIAKELRLDDLVANRTMSPDIAATLGDIARERRSFIVLAVPRLAGKSTVLRAILAERPASTPVQTVGEDEAEIDDLVKRSAAGYLVIPEITQSAAMPGYIWGSDVRRIFKSAKENVSLAATLHAEGPDDAFAQICKGCGVPDNDASRVAYVVALRSIGRWEQPTRRVVASVHEISRVEAGRPKGRLIHRWDEARDVFVSATNDAASSGRRRC